MHAAAQHFKSFSALQQKNLLKLSSYKEIMIEKYIPTPEVAEAWEQERDEFIARIYDVLARHGDIPVDAKLKY